jgi:hypothetical protein
VPLRKAPTFPPPPPMMPTSHTAPRLERERSPYGGATNDSSAIDTSDDEPPLSLPIERERKPYSAAPSGGRVFEESAAMKSDTETHTPGHRSQSSASQNQLPPFTAAGRSTDYPPSTTSRHHRTNSHLNGRRPRSPSFSNPGTRSDTFIGDLRYSTSNIYDSEEETRRFAKDAEAKRDWARRQAEEDAMGNHTRARADSGLNGATYGSQPRSAYDDEYYCSGRGGSTAYDGNVRSYGASYNDRRF